MVIESVFLIISCFLNLIYRWKMMENIILEVKGLSKHFGGIRAVRNVDLKLYYFIKDI